MLTPTTTGEAWSVLITEKLTLSVRWVVFGDHGSYRHMNEDVESVQCYCNIN